MRTRLMVACALAVFALAGVAGAVNEKDGSEMNAFDKLGPSIIASDSGISSGLTRTGRFSKVQITRYRCASSGDPSISVDMSCNDHRPYGQDWNPDNEIPIAVDPQDPDHLLSGSNDYYYRFNNSTGTRHVIVPTGFFTSFDGGATWIDGQIPFSSGNGAGDPAPGFVADPRSPAVTRPFALMAQLENVGPNTGCCVAQGNVTVSRSADGGRHWQRPVRVLHGHGAGIGPSNKAVFYDKEWLTVDNEPSSPYYGRIYVTSSKFVNGPHGAYFRSPIVISHSDDGGVTLVVPECHLRLEPKMHVPVGRAAWDGLRRGSILVSRGGFRRHLVCPFHERTERCRMGSLERLRRADHGRQVDRRRSYFHGSGRRRPARGRVQRHALLGRWRPDGLGSPDAVGVRREHLGEPAEPDGPDSRLERPRRGEPERN